ncbi:hypothetical protein [Paracoccus sp. PARArs4]|uniref:hypothetical protein n=1 Tax=Paracoccus sp. PARArs4 TaxID=2853442 RepID=UPI0024A634A9|nr:hypothetical protein [Paracoccus sp. PARArs4]
MDSYIKSSREFAAHCAHTHANIQTLRSGMMRFEVADGDYDMIEGKLKSSIAILEALQKKIERDKVVRDHLKAANENR